MDQNRLLKRNSLCNYTPTHVSEFNNGIAGASSVHTQSKECSKVTMSEKLPRGTVVGCRKRCFGKHCFSLLEISVRHISMRDCGPQGQLAWWWRPVWDESRAPFWGPWPVSLTVLHRAGVKQEPCVWEEPLAYDEFTGSGRCLRL